MRDGHIDAFKGASFKAESAESSKSNPIFEPTALPDKVAEVEMNGDLKKVSNESAALVSSNVGTGAGGALQLNGEMAKLQI